MLSTFRRSGPLVALVLALLLVGGCFKRTRPGEEFSKADIPTTFDVTITAAKDGLYEYNDVPLTSVDLKDAMRYRKDQAQPLATVLMQRGEKQRVTDSYISTIARLSHELGFRAFIKDKEGISEIRTSTAPAQ
ncbi:MAG: hypothetical protein ABIP56_08015 [Dokdonella sp.]